MVHGALNWFAEEYAGGEASGMTFTLSKYSSQWDLTTERIIGAAIEVHRALGPGLLEPAYESCLAEELGLRGLEFQRQLALPVTYRGRVLDCGYRIETVLPLHRAQLLTYLHLKRIPCGLLLNFNAATMKQGIFRLVLEEPPFSASPRLRGSESK